MIIPLRHIWENRNALNVAAMPKMDNQPAPRNPAVMWSSISINLGGRDRMVTKRDFGSWLSNWELTKFREARTASAIKDDEWVSAKYTAGKKK